MRTRCRVWEKDLLQFRTNRIIRSDVNLTLGFTIVVNNTIIVCVCVVRAYRVVPVDCIPVAILYFVRAAAAFGQLAHGVWSDS